MDLGSTALVNMIESFSHLMTKFLSVSWSFRREISAASPDALSYVHLVAKGSKITSNEDLTRVNLIIIGHRMNARALLHSRNGLEYSEVYIPFHHNSRRPQKLGRGNVFTIHGGAYLHLATGVPNHC